MSCAEVEILRNAIYGILLGSNAQGGIFGIQPAKITAVFRLYL